MKVLITVWISVVLIQEVVPISLIRLPRHVTNTSSIVHTEYEAKYNQKSLHGNESLSTLSGKQQFVHENCAENWNAFADKCASLIKELVASLANVVSSSPGDATNLQLQIKNTFRHFDNTHNCTCFNHTGKGLSAIDLSPFFNNITITTLSPTTKGASGNGSENCGGEGHSYPGSHGPDLKPVTVIVTPGEHGNTELELKAEESADPKKSNGLRDDEKSGMQPSHSDASSHDPTNNSRREAKYPQVLIQPGNTVHDPTIVYISPTSVLGNSTDVPGNSDLKTNNAPLVIISQKSTNKKEATSSNSGTNQCPSQTQKASPVVGAVEPTTVNQSELPPTVADTTVTNRPTRTSVTDTPSSNPVIGVSTNKVLKGHNTEPSLMVLTEPANDSRNSKRARVLSEELFEKGHTSVPVIKFYLPSTDIPVINSISNLPESTTPETITPDPSPSPSSLAETEYPENLSSEEDEQPVEKVFVVTPEPTTDVTEATEDDHLHGQNQQPFTTPIPIYYASNAPVTPGIEDQKTGENPHVTESKHAGPVIIVESPTILPTDGEHTGNTVPSATVQPVVVVINENEPSGNATPVSVVINPVPNTDRHSKNTETPTVVEPVITLPNDDEHKEHEGDAKCLEHEGHEKHAKCAKHNPDGHHKHKKCEKCAKHKEHDGHQEHAKCAKHKEHDGHHEHSKCAKHKEHEGHHEHAKCSGNKAHGKCARNKEQEEHKEHEGHREHTKCEKCEKHKKREGHDEHAKDKEHDGHHEHTKCEKHKEHEGHDEHEKCPKHKEHEGHREHTKCEKCEKHKKREGHDEHAKDKEHDGHHEHTKCEKHKEHEGHDEHEKCPKHKEHEGHHEHAKCAEHEKCAKHKEHDGHQEHGKCAKHKEHDGHHEHAKCEKPKEHEGHEEHGKCAKHKEHDEHHEHGKCPKHKEHEEHAKCDEHEEPTESKHSDPVVSLNHTHAVPHTDEHLRDTLTPAVVQPVVVVINENEHSGKAPPVSVVVKPATVPTEEHLGSTETPAVVEHDVPGTFEHSEKATPEVTPNHTHVVPHTDGHLRDTLTPAVVQPVVVVINENEHSGKAPPVPVVVKPATVPNSDEHSEKTVTPTVVEPSVVVVPEVHVQSDQSGNNHSVIINPTTFQTTSADPTTQHPLHSLSTIKPHTDPQDSDEALLTHPITSPKTAIDHVDHEDEEDDCCSCESCTEEEITNPIRFRDTACKNLEEARRELKKIFDKMTKKLQCGRSSRQHPVTSTVIPTSA